MAIQMDDFSQSVLETKLTSPVLPSKTVFRRRLIRKLEEGASKKLTIVTAAAGFGKTTLVRSWEAIQHADEHPVAWVSLDKHDDTHHFWAYILSALHRLDEDFSFSANRIIQSDPSTIDYPFLDELLNTLAAIPRPFTLILEDYHCITSEVINDSLTYLIAHAPTNFHLIIVSRTIPNIPLARLRSQEQVTEITATDLAFTEDETIEYLQAIMGVSLENKNLALFREITDGWIAGMQIAALSIQNGNNADKVLAGFSGKTSRVFDYFTEEVIQRQSWEVRDFLIHTSFLEWMTPDLCDAALDITTSRDHLRYLEQAGLFLIPLDEERQCYRYHPLFHNYLRSILAQARPDTIDDMERAAYRWLAEHGYHEQAIQHALACEDYEGAACSLEKAYGHTTLFKSEILTVLQWIKCIPDEVIRAHPQLALLSLRAHVDFGQLDTLQEAIIRYSDTLERLSNEDVEGTEIHSIYDETCMVLAIAACARGDYERAFEFNEEISPEAKRDVQSHIGSLFTHFMHHAYRAYGMSGDALLVLRKTLRHAEQQESDDDYLVVSCSLGQLLRDMGRLSEAINIYHEALERLQRKNYDTSLIALVEAGYSDICRERNKLAQADEYARLASLTRGHEELADPFAWHCEPDYMLIVANNQFDHGNYEASLATLRKLRSTTDLYYRIPFLRSLADALLVRCWIMLGYTTRIVEWVEEARKALLVEQRYTSTPTMIELARALLFCGEPKEALAMLPDMPDRGKSPSSFYRFWIEGCLIQARAFFQTKERAKARASLVRAIELAEPEGFIRVFVEEGPSLKPLLGSVREEIVRTGSSRLPRAQVDFTQQLWTACLEAWEHDVASSRIIERRLFTPTEPLSNREAEVLKLVAGGLTVEQVSKQLFISMYTTRTHIKNIYRKLNAHSREEAVERAVEMGLTS